MISRSLWLLTFCLFLLLCHVSAQALPNSPGRYLQRLHECTEILQQGEGRLSPEETDRLIGCLPARLAVLDEGGEAIYIYVDEWHRRVKQAQGMEDGRRRLLRHLRSLQEQLSHMPDTPPQGLLPRPWNELRAKLQEVYRAREFRYLRPRQGPLWLEYFRELCYRFIRWLQQHLPSSTALGPPWIAWGIYGAILLAALLTLVWILRGGRLPQGTKGGQGPTWAKNRSKGPGSFSWDWMERRERARFLARRGAHREAIREVFVSVLMEGQARGWWSYQPQATNGEHLARIEGSCRREVFLRLMRHYERIWYGLRPASETDYIACMQWAAQLEQAA